MLYIATKQQQDKMEHNEVIEMWRKKESFSRRENIERVDGEQLAIGDILYYYRDSVYKKVVSITKCFVSMHTLSRELVFHSGGEKRFTSSSPYITRSIRYEVYKYLPDILEFPDEKRYVKKVSKKEVQYHFARCLDREQLFQGKDIEGGLC